MTVSFHKFGDYFPGTGDVGDYGYGQGLHYSVNFPLKDGINDESYRDVFEPIMSKVMVGREEIDLLSFLPYSNLGLFAKNVLHNLIRSIYDLGMVLPRRCGASMRCRLA